MVLTDLPFERGKLLHSRYDMIHRAESAPPSNSLSSGSGDVLESKEYATFLKLQERKVGPEGFLDSSRYSHTFQLKKEKESKTPTKKRLRAHSDTSSSLNVVSLISRIENDEKNYQRQIKVVEDHMWQHKQEERELKRIEGDIIKNQRAVRHTLRDFGNVVNKKRTAEDKKLNQSLERFAGMQREHIHKTREISRMRSEQNTMTLHEQKQYDRKVLLNLTDLALKYKEKIAALELKRTEVKRLNNEFESKLRSKEEEQNRLKQELAELAITLNMAAQKGRVQRFEQSRSQKSETTQRIQNDIESNKNVENKMKKSDYDIKDAEMTKRKLSADLSLTKAHLDIKKRDEQRHLIDTQMRLEDNTAVQRQLNETARCAEMDLKAKQIDQTLEAHNMKRLSRLQTRTQTKQDKEATQQAVWEARFRVRALEAERRKHEDHLKFFQKMVTKDEEKEQALYKNVREAEYARQQQDAEVRRLQQTLLGIRTQHAKKLKNEAAHCNQTEAELEFLLIKEKAKLEKLHAQREENYLKLQAHRHVMKEDKHLLDEHEREHTRLLRIGARSDLTQEIY